MVHAIKEDCVQLFGSFQMLHQAECRSVDLDIREGCSFPAPGLMRGVLLQDEEMADPGAVPSLEHLCISTVEDNLEPHNVCKTLEAIAILQPALQELLNHLLQFLSRHLKDVLSRKVISFFLPNLLTE